jgi:hypothetical protein
MGQNPNPSSTPAFPLSPAADMEIEQAMGAMCLCAEYVRHKERKRSHGGVLHCQSSALPFQP